MTFNFIEDFIAATLEETDYDLGWHYPALTIANRSELLQEGVTHELGVEILHALDVVSVEFKTIEPISVVWSSL